MHVQPVVKHGLYVGNLNYICDYSCAPTAPAHALRSPCLRPVVRSAHWTFRPAFDSRQLKQFKQIRPRFMKIFLYSVFAGILWF